MKRVSELKQQLAEKDNLLKLYPRLEDMYPQLPTIVINTQDKISFAVEQLEKVKEKLNELFENEHGCAVITDVFDRQIEELKKEMK